MSAERYYYHAVAVDENGDERDLYAAGDDWIIDDALDHFNADLVGDEYLHSIEEVEPEDYPTDLEPDLIDALPA